MQIPLFPLSTVLFPGGPLPLRIFEPRYLDMVSSCLRNESSFGVLLIREGGETGPATTYSTGTLAHITDWYQGSDGLLGVTAVGQQRFRLASSHQQTNGLSIGEIAVLPDEPALPLPDEYRGIAEILAGVLDDLGRLYDSLECHYDDAGWVSARFVEILPISLYSKQQYLEKGDPIERLKIVSELLNDTRNQPAGLHR